MPVYDVEIELADLFQEAGAAHHEAFKATDGDDPEWPLWYSEFLHEKLQKLLGASFTRSELVYLLVLAEGDRRAVAPGSEWTRYFSAFFGDRYI